jgi:alpha-tubulin suppressor-like RCC1 family protein
MKKIFLLIFMFLGLNNPLLSWENTSIIPLSDGQGLFTQVVLDKNDIPYIIFKDNGNEGKLTVMKYISNSWIYVGLKGITSNAADYGTISFDNNNTPYVVFQDYSINRKASVMRYNGTSWEYVGTPGFSEGIAHYTDIKINNSNIPYVAFRDDGIGTTNVFYFINNTWTQVPNTIFTETDVHNIKLNIDKDNNLYLFYTWFGHGNGILKKYNGINWSFICYSDAFTGFADLKFNLDDELYISFSNIGDGRKVTVKKLSNNSFINVGTGDITSGGSYWTSLTIDKNNNIYVSYQDVAASNKLSVQKYNGVNWEYVGSQGITSSGAYYTSIAITENKKLFVCFQDESIGRKVSVLVRNLPTLPEISTIEVKDVSAETAIIRGNITSDGNTDIIERGVVYATTQNPTLSNNKVVRSGTSIGKYSTVVKGLEPLTTYYARPYVTNSVGTVYGDQITFTTRNYNIMLAWGHNNYGQLGIGNTDEQTTPIQLNNENKWKNVESSIFHNIALKEDGTLWGWGGNSNYELGLGNTTDQLSPIQIGNSSNWKVITVGSSHSLGIKEDGTLWAWGYNASGQLGLGHNHIQNIPTKVGTDSDWESISSGGSHLIAVKEDGSLWAWGFNNDGQLGLGNLLSVNIPTQIGNENNWKSIEAGGAHNFAFKEDGSLWVWGRNDTRQLGIGNNEDKMVPFPIVNQNDWQSVIAGGNFSIGIKQGGSLWTWGDNNLGQLGIGNNINQNLPVQVGSNENWIKINTGSDHCLAINQNNELWVWGRNETYQLGLNNNDNQNLPIRLGNSNYWNKTNGGTNYSLALVEANNFLSPEPTIQSKSITFHSITKNRIGLRWTKGNGSKRVALASMGTLNNAEYLTDRTGYTAGNYGVNTLPNNTNVSVVYNGDNTTCLVEGLARNTTYYFRIIEYNGSGASANYLQTSASGNPSSKKTNKKESEEEISSSLINVYPNPVNDVLNIEFNKDFNNIIDNAKLTIINEVGQEVYSTKNTNNLLTINTLDLVNGVYHIIISNDNESIYHSFVIER